MRPGLTRGREVVSPPQPIPQWVNKVRLLPFFLPRAGGCTCCGESLAGVVPYERLQYKYCTMDCLKEHRAQLNKR